jgi:hypothetical protein
MGKKRNVYRLLVGKPEGKRPNSCEFGIELSGFITILGNYRVT